MQCPKCKQADLDQNIGKLPGAGYRAPYSCSQCGGMWVKSDELKKVAEIAEIFQEPPDKAASGPADKEPDNRTGLCPEGHGLMIRAKVDLDPHFYLERCTTCGGIWFDKGEWGRIIENNLAEDLPVIWTLAWQRKHQHEKNRESYLASNKKVLGEELFDIILKVAGLLKNHPERLRALALLRREILDDAD